MYIINELSFTNIYIYIFSFTFEVFFAVQRGKSVQRWRAGTERECSAERKQRMQLAQFRYLYEVIFTQMRFIEGERDFVNRIKIPKRIT